MTNLCSISNGTITKECDRDSGMLVKIIEWIPRYRGGRESGAFRSTLHNIDYRRFTKVLKMTDYSLITGIAAVWGSGAGVSSKSVAEASSQRPTSRRSSP